MEAQRGEVKHLSTRREKKSTEIALVAASERARAQISAVSSRHALPLGGCGVFPEPRVGGSFHAREYLKGLERPTIEGDSPVGEIRGGGMGEIPEYHGTRGTPWEAGTTTFQG